MAESTSPSRSPASAATTPRLYHDLVSWYPLVDPVADHADEAAVYEATFERAVSPRPETLLELGSGAGNNAFHLKRRFRCTLTDVSEPMLGLSRAKNPDCEHIAGDMRSVALDRTFDAVLVHDAVMYLTREADLLAVAHTAFQHTRPGGVALFVPDCTRESFRERADTIARTDGTRTLRGIEWSWDPDPGDDTFVTEFALLLRDGAEVTAVHDRHVEGLFATAAWQRVLEAPGYRVDVVANPMEDGLAEVYFLCRRP